MKQAQELKKMLTQLDGQKYGAYKRTKGMYQFDDFRLAIDHVQVDPFASPSKMRLIIDRKVVGIPADFLDTKDKRIAVADFLTRNVARKLKSILSKAKGQHKIFIDRCGQEMLQRTSVVINDDVIEVRLEVGLPAAGRKILGKAAASTITQVLPQVVNQALKYQHMDQQALKRQIELKLNQTYIREQLDQQNLIAFVANGSILPRKSGVSDWPMPQAIEFSSPKSCEITMEVPYGKPVVGMGIPKGITLIVGGGYHGKSTLLQALERGVYDHINGDGREYVITNNSAMKIRAEDGRSVEKVNIQPFIDHLPGKKDTSQFSTDNASGSTSQATNVMEALEARTKVLLIDEDTSATNFMIRDGRMQKLIAPEKEPITPFSNRVKPLYDDYDVSTILIVGGSGDYFEVADQVLMMDEYVLKDVTKEAKEIAQTAGYEREDTSHKTFGEIPSRIPLKNSFNKKGKDSRLKAKGQHAVMYGKETIDINGLEQLVDDSQTNTLAMMIDYIQQHELGNDKTINDIVDDVYQLIEHKGLETISHHQGHPGNLALPRKQELIGTLNRYRGLNMK
ncbi:ABC-ATPase domain-containing protein [Staphylococcus pasteuri]|uniref:ABC-ATPase domain-containing protein n=2 Tax=Bacteria TaxID=2 RepID=UPI001E3DC289|nr:ABC-ATPase domain-containing protein [Staphylococcus pasteuri]MCD9066718.1 ABC-ATPase domain-containing protein [Staphylococcus pasteuri]WAE41920.1 ABC-ATPase domain-containing protein [Staphylococcus pasteuri]